MRGGKLSVHGQFQGIKMISVAMEFESGVHDQLLQSGVRWLKIHMKMQSVEFSLYIKKLPTWLIQIRSQELGDLKSISN